MVLPITKTTLSARLLPSYKALRTLYKADDLSFFSPMVTHSLVNKIATMEKGDALDLYLSQKARGNYKRLMALGRILCIHSNEGRPIAQKLFDQALAAKDMDSEFTFADFLSKGIVTGKLETKRSLVYIDSLAERHHPEALYVKALQALKKVKQESDHKLAIELLKKASDAGSADASLQIGRIFQKGNRPLDALQYIQKAHEKGKVEATFTLGSLYAQGHASPDGNPNMNRAFELYEAASSKGLSVAQYNLGSLYMDGIDTESFKLPKNPKFAIEYWKMAAEQGFDLACINLATYYFRGDGPHGIDKVLSGEFLGRIDMEKTTQRDVVEALRAQLQLRDA